MLTIFFRVVENINPDKAVQLYQQTAAVFEVSPLNTMSSEKASVLRMVGNDTPHGRGSSQKFCRSQDSWGVGHVFGLAWEMGASATVLGKEAISLPFFNLTPVQTLHKVLKMPSTSLDYLQLLDLILPHLCLVHVISLYLFCNLWKTLY